tara:strand:+ start:176 stop:337 length:162 start_codon:yes stop_codon:yes gene_type:complete
MLFIAFLNNFFWKKVCSKEEKLPYLKTKKDKEKKSLKDNNEKVVEKLVRDLNI